MTLLAAGTNTAQHFAAKCRTSVARLDIRASEPVRVILSSLPAIIHDADGSRWSGAEEWVSAMVGMRQVRIEVRVPVGSEAWLTIVNAGSSSASVWYEFLRGYPCSDAEND